MADFDSSLPVRTEAAGDVAVKIVDSTVTSQQLTVESDGSINVNTSLPVGTKVEITDGTDDLAINADGSINATVSATDLDIRDLSSAQDSVSVLQATHDNLNANANIQVGDADVGNANPVPVSDAGGSITVDAADLDIRDLAFATDSVDVSGSSVTATVSATDLDIRDLAFATDSVDVSGSSVTATVSATDLDIRDLSSATDSVTVLATDLDIRDLAFATDSVDVSGSAVTATVSATDLDIRDLSSATDSVTVVASDLDVRDLSAAQDNVAISDGTDTLAVNTDGSINVVVQEDAGLEVVDYNTAASIAGGATDNHDWTSGAASRLYQVLASASGKLKVEVQIETAAASGVFNTVAVAFNSTANPNIDLDLRKFAVVPNGARVRVIRENRDKQAQDVYSTIVAIQG